MVYTMIKMGGVQYIKIFSMTMAKLTVFVTDGIICIIHVSAARLFEPWHGISNNVVCATSEASDQPAHTRSLIRAIASRLNIL